ncbi:putative efflux protein, MATE family [Spirosomataceae bacterium TFI 002]|nr:putative efflux protein, MATE family [Spirosomataceae bacterium TFI 002]
MKKILSLIKESLQHDENRDFTELSINKAIFLLSLPMVIEMSFEALFALVDAFFVARYVGIDGVATVGLTESVLTLVYSLAWGISIASSAVIARRIGEKNPEEGGKALAQIILISVVIGLVIAVFGYLNAERILQMMGAEPSVVEAGVRYTEIQFISAPIIILIFTLSGALRGAGNASTAMKSVIIANVLNIFLDFLFIPVFEIGVEGAAYATLIGRTVGVIYQLWALLGDNQKIKLTATLFRPARKIIVNILRIGAGSTAQFLIQSASWVFLVRILSIYGSEVIAGYTIAIRIIIFTILPSWGLSNSAATLVGQNLGAGKPDRAAKSAWKVAYINMAFLFVIAIVFFFFAESFVSWFDSTPRVVETGVLCLKILAIGYVFFGAGMVITQAINGAGDTAAPTVFNLICFWAIQIPLAYYLGEVVGWQEEGVFYALIISETLLAIIAIIYFKSGRWQKATV